MADAAIGDEKCLLPTCSKSGPLTTFKLPAVKKLIDCATERQDDETRRRMQSILDSKGEQASVELHKNCYCSFTSKNNVQRCVARKRKAGLRDNDEAPVPRIRRSQVIEFDFKEQCLFLC